MTKEELKELIETGREIEFTYNKKRYSITYSNENVKDYISFCEFYKETTDISSVDELCKVEREGVTVLEMLESLTDKDISVY